MRIRREGKGATKTVALEVEGDDGLYDHIAAITERPVAEIKTRLEQGERIETPFSFYERVKQ